MTGKFALGLIIKLFFCTRHLQPRYRPVQCVVNRMDNSKMRERQEDGQGLSQCSRYYYCCNSHKNIEFDANFGRYCVDVMNPLCFSLLVG
jgi:hypothetical protein